MTPPAFPRASRPVVSVVMVTYGARPWVERSLDALRRHTVLPYELVVVENASPDGTAEWLERTLVGATLVRNHRNVGFGPAANQGALHARGRLLCVLNSDTLVEAGWLEPLVDVLRADPTAGVVVPRKLDLDGALQEACSMLDRSGRVHLYGRGADPLDPVYRFPRRRTSAVPPAFSCAGTSSFVWAASTPF